MKTLFQRSFAWVLAVIMLLLSGCGQVQPTTTHTTDPSTAPSGSQGNPDDEYTLPKEEGYNQITFYWNYLGDLSNCDVWVWWDGKEGSGYLMHECSYGGKAVINVPEGIEQVGFIVRKDCSEPGGNAWGNATKDWQEDRFAVLEGEETFIYLKEGQAAQYSSDDGGKTLVEIKKFTLAGMIDFNTIQYSLTPKVTLTTLDQIKLYDGDREVPISSVTNMNVASTTANIKVEEKLDITKIYEIEIEGYGRKAVMPTRVFDSQEFIDNYTYDGDDLGPVIRGDNTTFKVWAPTASKVVLNLFEAGNGGSAYKTVEMVRGEKGVWEHTEPCGHGTYYTYSVTTAAGTQEATDPYAKSAGLNGDRSMVIDLDSTDPVNWDAPYTAGTDTYTQAVIWEVHVRDFSNKIVSSQYKGKYLAFTERGLTNSAGVSIGVDYLVNLGITHVHLLPVYDYATVDEANPDSQFNWGYDPKNYNVPEGSYATNPYDGAVRVNEYKQMVQALHEAGIGVVMDVVYNHTYDANSSLNRIVPYYYYRYTASGANSSASGCGNDTASERYMYRKFMVDSVSYWAEEYKLDGFRFDLMGLHDLETMRQIEQAVHAINPDALIYGEGWTMGSTIDGSAQANQTNIDNIKPSEGAAGAVAVFNDAIRDGLKGSVFQTTSKGYINGNFKGAALQVKFGIAGGGLNAGVGWRVSKNGVINYMSAHDNNTLWDKLALSNPDNTVEERLAMNRLGAAIVMISHGTPFWQAGEEMLRSKPKADGGFDENSYKSSDEINNIDWEVLVPGSIEYEMMCYYQGLIAMRKSVSLFTAQSGVAVSFKDLPGGGMVVTFDNHMGGFAKVVINPTEQTDTFTLDGEWKLIATDTQAGSQTIRVDSGEVQIPARGILVYVN
ncbi:MAG: type I pullulanase [Ruminococcaceae bacterium]|nr:type I pullulanase [Oscillospiraceae bacterium]